MAKNTPTQTNDSPFAGAEREYERLRDELDAGHLSGEEFTRAIATLTVEQNGRSWRLGSAGLWEVEQGGAWTIATPPTAAEPTAPRAAAPAPEPPAATHKSALPAASVFDIVLADAGPRRVDVVKLIREMSLGALDLADAKALLDDAPVTIRTSVDQAEADDVKQQFERAGASIEIQPARTTPKTSRSPVVRSTVRAAPKKTPAWDVITLAGTGHSGFTDDSREGAQFSNPLGVAVAPDGAVLVADMGNRRIRMIDRDGLVNTLAGTGKWRDGKKDGPHQAATFQCPTAIAVDENDPWNAYVTEADGPVRWFRQSDMSVVSLTGGFRPGAGFKGLSGIAVDLRGAIYVSDRGGAFHCIHKLMVGAPVICIGSRPPAMTGPYRDGPANEAVFDQPAGLACDRQGRLYVADAGNHCIRLVDLDGSVTTVAGSMNWRGAGGFADGPPDKALFNRPAAVAVDHEGIVYVADTGNHRIRRIDLENRVTTVAGTGQPGLHNGLGHAASFNLPASIAIGPDNALYVADTGNHAIRRLMPR